MRPLTFDQFTVTASARNRWCLALSGGLDLEIAARLLDGWLLCDAPAPGNFTPESMLAQNAVLPAFVKLAPDCAGAARWRAEMPLEDDSAAESSLRDLAPVLRCCRSANRGPRTGGIARRAAAGIGSHSGNLRRGGLAPCVPPRPVSRRTRVRLSTSRHADPGRSGTSRGRRSRSPQRRFGNLRAGCRDAACHGGRPRLQKYFCH